MSKRSSAIALAILLGGAALIGRACIDRGGGAEETASPASGAPSPPRRRPGTLPPPGGAASAAGEPQEKGAPGAAAAFTASWGGRLDQLGRDRPVEGNPEGPMSLAADRKGRLLVLDQVNDRMVRYGADGKPEKAIGVDLRTAQDVATGDDGSLAVLDRFTDKAVTLYDESGQVVAKLPLQGEGVDEPGNVTGVFVDGKDVYVERQHGPLVRIGDTSGAPADPRSEIPGRPSRDGLSFLNAGIVDAQAGRAYVSSIERATMQHRFTRELRLEAVILTIVLLDTDRSGIIYFGTQLQEGPGDEIVQVTCLEPLKGQPIGTAVMPANTLPDETFRDLTVLDDGGVVYALRSETGVTYQRYDCR